MEKFLTSENIMMTFMVLLAIAWAYNIVSQAIQNGKNAVNQSQKPFNRIDGTLEEMRKKCDIHVRELDNRIDNIERRLSEHDEAIKDLHAGQSAICRGVQALLDHELHDGNEEEMKAASEGIGKWLRTR